MAVIGLHIHVIFGYILKQEMFLISAKCDINKFIGGKPLPWFIGGSVSNVTTNNIVKADGIGIATSKYPLSYFQRILG